VLNVPLGERVVASLGANLQSERGGYFNATNVDKLSNFTLLDLTAALAFDRWKLSAYIKNVDDTLYLLQTVSNNGYYNAPREYGGSLRVAF
jgi:hypothetical protein